MESAIIKIHSAGIVMAVAIGMLLPACHRNSEATTAATETLTNSTFQATCATCHGESGQGIKENGTPTIASLPRWYLEEQITKFRNGQRGKHVDDLNGQVMRAAISALSEQQITEALDDVEQLPLPDHKATFSGDVENGATLYREHCMECHRFNGRGEIAFRSSPLVGLQDWYLLDQWEKFRLGVRGYHAQDDSGIKMRKATDRLTDNEGIHDIIHYISSLPMKKQ